MRMVSASICLAISMQAQNEPTLSTLSGRAIDGLGTGLPGAAVELKLDSPARTFRKATDSNGWYAFERLPAGLYSIQIIIPGFNSLRVKSVLVSSAEEKVLPTLELQIGSVADCGGHAVLDHVVLRPDASTIRGIVRSEDGAERGIAGAGMGGFAEVSVREGALHFCPALREAFVFEEAGATECI